MKLKNKVLATALGIATLTGGMLITNQTYASAIAYTNNGGTLTNYESELENVKMLVDTQSGLIAINTYKDIKIGLNSSNLFVANTNYKLKIVGKDDISKWSKFSIKLVNSSGVTLKTIELSTTSTIKTDASMPYSVYTSTATFSSEEAFYVVITDSSSSLMGDSVSERIFDSISIIEADITAPVITISNDNLTYDVGTNNMSPTQIVAAYSSATDNIDGNVSTYLVSSNVDFNVVGRYTIVVGATDNAGNQSLAYIC